MKKSLLTLENQFASHKQLMTTLKNQVDLLNAEKIRANRERGQRSLAPRWDTAPETNHEEHEVTKNMAVVDFDIVEKLAKMENKIDKLTKTLSTEPWLHDDVKTQDAEISRLIAQILEKRQIPCRQIACIHGACLRSRCRQGHLISGLQASIARHEEMIAKMKSQSLKSEEGTTTTEKE